MAYQLYLFNKKTGERKEAPPTSSKSLSLSEAKRVIKNMGKFPSHYYGDGWMFKYEVMP